MELLNLDKFWEGIGFVDRQMGYQPTSEINRNNPPGVGRRQSTIRIGATHCPCCSAPITSTNANCAYCGVLIRTSSDTIELPRQADIYAPYMKNVHMHSLTEKWAMVR